MSYKKDKDDKFRYIVKNGINDIEVMCKTLQNNGPYQRIDIGILGAVPKLKLVTPRSSASTDLDKNIFTKVLSKKAKKHGKHVSRERLYERISRFTNYLDPVSEDSLSEEDAD